MKPSWLVVGCGRIAGSTDGAAGAPPASHASAFAAAGFRLAGCVDKHPGRARALALRHGFGAWGSNLAAMLARLRPDAVSVCAPDAAHASLALEVLRSPYAPRVLFIEKPVCETARELSRIADAARRRETSVLVNHSRRFDLRYKRLAALVRSGRLGRLLRADAWYYGGWRHNGVHAVDTLRFVTGSEAARPRVTERQPSKHKDDPTLGVEMEAGGARACVHPFDESAYQVFDLDIKLSRARIRIDNFEERWLLEERRRVGGENILRASAWKPGSSPPALAEAARLIARHLRRSDPDAIAPFGLREAAGTMRVIWGAR